MPFWPFKRRDPVSLTPTELRDKLIETAAAGPSRKLRSLCKDYRSQVAANAEFMAKLPEEVQADQSVMNGYANALIVVAQCLANDCGAPELWAKLTGTPDDNPWLALDQWFGEVLQRMQQLEYDTLITEGHQHLDKLRSLKGTNATNYETYVLGRLGELNFQSGQVSSAIEPFKTALEMCESSGDIEGQIAYVNNLFEVHRYLGKTELALDFRRQALELTKQQGGGTEQIERHIDLMGKGEPLCRVVCVRNGVEVELEDITSVGEGSYKFQFQRNRISLLKADTLVQQGNALASSGNLSDALEKYQEAMDVDPHGPDPVYQSGTCLLELGAYSKARETYEDVERLAPGWFRCRSDIWLARSLEEGTVSDEEFRVLRALEDGGLEPQQALSVVKQAIDRFPDFAPLHLLCGESHGQLGDEKEAKRWYRNGLEHVQEPDLESRLLCALAALLPSGSSERDETVKQATNLKGNLVAMATAKLIGLQ